MGEESESLEALLEEKSAERSQEIGEMAKAITSELGSLGLDYMTYHHGPLKVLVDRRTQSDIKIKYAGRKVFRSGEGYSLKNDVPEEEWEGLLREAYRAALDAREERLLEVGAREVETIVRERVNNARARKFFERSMLIIEEYGRGEDFHTYKDYGDKNNRLRIRVNPRPRPILRIRHNGIDVYEERDAKVETYISGAWEEMVDTIYEKASERRRTRREKSERDFDEMWDNINNDEVEDFRRRFVKSEKPIKDSPLKDQ